MGIFTLICLSISLSADAFVAAVCDGIAYRPRVSKRIAITLLFGVAQGVMPVIGYFIGDAFSQLYDVKNYLSFAALLIIGTLMLIEGCEKQVNTPRTLSVKTIILQAVATSIDALAGGFTLAVLPFPLWVDSIVIAGITATVCAIGVSFSAAIGKSFGAKPQRCKILGGSILIALALKNLAACFI